LDNELNQILISYNQPDFNNQLDNCFVAMAGMSHFGVGDLQAENFQKVVEILGEVAKKGNAAVAEFTEQFDGVKLTPEQFRIPKKDLEKAHKQIDKELLISLRQAIDNVRKYQTEIFVANKEQNCYPGIKYTPIKRVGICIPGASAPLPSTVIMTAVPARVAGVRELVIVSPPRYNGSIHPVILAICHELGIEGVYRIGGAQAVAALAYGTKTINIVNKIVGPGNKWVQTAKQIVSGGVGIDSMAGPSEVLIIANDEANPAWVAADMLSQAEHDPGSAILFTDSSSLAEKVLEELKAQVKQLDRCDETIKCLRKFSKIVLFGDRDNLIYWANEFAPEHLEIQCGDQSKKIAEQIDNAGAIFIGDYSPVAVGDYWAGPSHTLPTGKTAKFSSPLSSNDFIKSTSIIEYDRDKLAASAEDIIRMAQAEGLDAHAKSISIRRQQ
jgi:histidinol dehydrogenase